ncbi:hypothetical protein Pelo_16866 [Pelomyxa schiedti]|nr:hypothetical protein Pelo_16866 [Pelomyxa schiedti]
MNAGSRRVVDVPQALVLPKFYLRSSSLNLFFNRAADDEAVLMFFGEARTQELPSLVSLRLVCITQTWATKSLTELSSTRSAVYTCPSSAVVCQSRLLGGAHTFVVITQHPDRRRYAAVIEEGTGRQTTLLTRVRDKGKVCYAMSLGQLSGSLFCIGYCDVDVADMHSTESRFFAFKMAGSSPTWAALSSQSQRINATRVVAFR